MTFLATGFAAESGLVVRGNGLILRPLTASDYNEWANLRDVSRDHLKPWEPTWATDELSQTSFRRRLRHYKRESRADLGYAFGIVDAQKNRLIGGMTLSNVRRGVSQCACLGYWIGAKYVRQAIMTRAVEILTPFAFKELRLHRLEAASMPSNSASIKVLERNGFVREGYARRMLKIDGQWEDHILFGLLADDVELAEVESR